MSAEVERAVAGAAILVESVARTLLAELDLELETIADPTARLALWAVRRGLEAEELAEDLAGTSTCPRVSRRP